MPFVPWDELTPAGGDPASAGDDRIREFKVQTRERAASSFSDWGTATDRITMHRIFTAAANLLIKKSDDSVTLATFRDGESLALKKPYICFLKHDTALALGDVNTTEKFPSNPTEYYDPYNWHDAGTPWVITVPIAGNYWVTYGYTVDNPSVGASLITRTQLRVNGIASTNLSSEHHNTTVINGKSTAFLRVLHTLAAADTIVPFFLGNGNTAQAVYSQLFFGLELANET